ncbi:MAG: T9SS type A sorting domain-containing protein [Candidatus Latescibacteria bacterium]|nr:T9SS type A sorting domain-containing protein [Candidatus Latescibacterota bacterium]
MLRTLRFLLAPVALSLLLSGPSAIAQDSYEPGTYQLAPTVNLNLQPVDVEIDDQFSLPPLTLNLPSGFSASVFAVPGGSSRPRMLAFDDNGVMHVAHSNRIVALPDRDGDGVADEVIVSASGLTWTNDLAFYKGDLYAAETDKIIHYRDKDGDLVYEDEEIFIDDLPWASGAWHTSRAIAFDHINEKFYVAIGAPCDLCTPDEPFRAASLDRLEPNPEWNALLEFNADGTGRRIYADGMRNVVGLRISPLTNEPWGVHNGHDREGPHLPPEWIDVIRDGDFQGYPFVYGYQVPVDFTIDLYEEVGILPLTAEEEALAAKQTAPTALVEAHQAPLGIHFYQGELFPPRYHNTPFVALHGGQIEGNLSVVPGFKVIALFSEPDGANAQVADFITGLGPPDRENIWGKPVGITNDAQGNMYVSVDWPSNAILKISHSAVSGDWEHNLPTSVPIGSTLTADALIRLLRLAEGGGALTITADLSAFGGPSDLLLSASGDSTYQLDQSLAVEGPLGSRTLSVLIEQQVGGIPHRMSLLQTIDVVSAIGGTWEHSLPDSVFNGTDLRLAIEVHLERQALDRGAPIVTADLSNFGGSSAVPLELGPDNTYILDTSIKVDGPNGPRQILISAVQDPDLDAFQAHFTKNITILPAGDERILADAVGRGWGFVTRGGAAPPQLTDAGPVFEGTQASAVQVEPERSFVNWEVDLVPDVPLDAFGYETLRFAFHPGDAAGGGLTTFLVTINDFTVDLIRGRSGFRIDLETPEWQVFEIPMSLFSITFDQYETDRHEEVEAVQFIRFAGNLSGTFYLDDVRLVSALEAPITAVLEERTGDTPGNFALDQNFPNPFNSGTSIRFTLPQADRVELTVFNLAGQPVVKLIDGRRPAGAYTISWDGRGQNDQELASGTYLYRLRAGDQVTTRKLLLLR